MNKGMSEQHYRHLDMFLTSSLLLLLPKSKSYAKRHSRTPSTFFLYAATVNGSEGSGFGGFNTRKFMRSVFSNTLGRFLRIACTRAHCLDTRPHPFTLSHDYNLSAAAPPRKDFAMPPLRRRRVLASLLIALALLINDGARKSATFGANTPERRPRGVSRRSSSCLRPSATPLDVEANISTPFRCCLPPSVRDPLYYVFWEEGVVSCPSWGGACYKQADNVGHEILLFVNASAVFRSYTCVYKYLVSHKTAGKIVTLNIKGYDAFVTSEYLTAAPATVTASINNTNTTNDFNTTATPTSSSITSSLDLPIGVAVSLLLFFGLVAIGAVFSYRRYQNAVYDFENDSGRGSRQDEVLLVPSRVEIPPDLLTIGEQLGVGHFGNVMKATMRSPNGSMDVAVKTIRNPDDEIAMRNFIGESQLLMNLGDHDHVVKIYGFSLQNNVLSIVMEYAQNGDLRSLLRRRARSRLSIRDSGVDDVTPGSPPPSSSSSLVPQDIRLTLRTCNSETQMLSDLKIYDYALQIAKGMKFVISKHFVHGDLAARNILVGNDDVLKISDFGLAKDLGGSEYYKRTKPIVLPFRWCSPEVLMRKIYSEYSDVWSYGILLWEMATSGGTPYPGVAVEKLFDLLMTDSYRMSKPRGCSQTLYDIMVECWDEVPDRRPRFASLVQKFQELLDEAKKEACHEALHRASSLDTSVKRGIWHGPISF